MIFDSPCSEFNRLPATKSGAVRSGAPRFGGRRTQRALNVQTFGSGTVRDGFQASASGGDQGYYHQGSSNIGGDYRQVRDCGENELILFCSR